MHSSGRRKKFIHQGLTAALTLLVILSGVLLPSPAHAAPLRQEYTYGECSRVDESALQAEMTTLAHSVLVEGSSGLKIDELVASTWRTAGADAVCDAAVNGGIARIQAERGYWERLWSGWSSNKAAEFANQVATYAFDDPALKAKLDEISTSIANSLVVELQSAAARSASSALLCLQSYVGEKYSATLFNAFQITVTQDVNADLSLSQSDTAHLSPLEMHSKGLAGVGVIVATEITRRVAVELAEKLTERLVGRIAGRVLGRLGSSVIPYIGWAVGVGLLVWDLWDGSQGALPTIRDSLQAEEVKQEVRAEISAAVAEGVAAEVETLPSTLAATLVTQWREFCGNHGAVCDLAAENESFRAILDNMPVDDLTRLVQLTDFFLTDFGTETVKKSDTVSDTVSSTETDAEAGKTQLAAALADGTFAKLVAAPPTADAILQATASPATTLAWVELAGDELASVVELQLYETIDPLRMSTLSLAALLAISDNVIIHKLVLLPTDQLLVLLKVPTADLTQVASVATPDELGWLAGYLAKLPSGEANRVAHELASGKVTIATLQAPPVVEATSDERADSKATANNTPDKNVPSAETNPAMAELPQIMAELWRLWANNGVAVAAGVMVLLLLAVGIALAIQRESTDPPV
jgi:hypothetical protein